MRGRVLLIVLIVTWAAGIVRAASHSGIVTFGGLPVPGATVTATRADVTRTTTTDAAGEYGSAILTRACGRFRSRCAGSFPRHAR